MTIGVLIVTYLHRVRRIHKAAQMPLRRVTSITCAWAVPTARRPWTLCVWLPFAAACCYTLFYLLIMPAARLVCNDRHQIFRKGLCQKRCSSSSSAHVANFSYFLTPLANFLLSRPNFVECGNSKTTTLLHSAKCTHPLFQGRTGCGGRPSGWHDIVTCQRVVYFQNIVLTS